jgi:hypothetical protein
LLPLVLRLIPHTHTHTHTRSTRYFALSGGRLLFFKAKSDTKAQGGLDISKFATVKMGDETDKKLIEKAFTFVIRTELCPAGLYLSCEGVNARKDRKAWVRSVRAVIRTQKEKAENDRGMTMSRESMAPNFDHSQMLRQISILSPRGQSSEMKF